MEPAASHEQHVMRVINKEGTPVVPHAFKDRFGNVKDSFVVKNQNILLKEDSTIRKEKLISKARSIVFMRA